MEQESRIAVMAIIVENNYGTGKQNCGHGDYCGES